ncbi:hypothetical protein MNKW57_19060 [Biformimicrobium ophioploci]|uniref:Uncharacterized protein n=1 Tax=Biformimicrobium ophioploci TaxID=3036711 RepID=A0ABQ6LZS7_9GAMM|nr:hypothetical protein MNKW57_19060 [Microbulbifer sp. NKW57]
MGAETAASRGKVGYITGQLALQELLGIGAGDLHQPQMAEVKKAQTGLCRWKFGALRGYLRTLACKELLPGSVCHGVIRAFGIRRY